MESTLLVGGSVRPAGGGRLGADRFERLGHPVSSFMDAVSAPRADASR